MKRLLSALWYGGKVLNKPLPAWATLLLLTVAAAGAAVPVYYGSVNVPAAGSITDNALSASTFTCTTASKVLTSTLSNCGALPVAQAGTNLTSLAGSKCIRSASTTAFAEATTDCPVLSSNTFTGSQAITTSTNPITVGASSAYTTQALKVFSGGGAGQYTDFFTTAGATIAGINATAFGVDIDNATNLLAFDRSGNLGVLGALKAGAGVAAGGAITGATTINASGQITGAGIAAGGAITGATTINASGLITGVGMTAGTGTVQGSSNGSTVSYVAPGYTQAGGALAATLHIAMNGCNVPNGATTCTVTLSGAGLDSGAAPVFIGTQLLTGGGCGTTSGQANISAHVITVTISAAAGGAGCSVNVMYLGP